ncbi:MAG: hypothetical protein M1837_000093 [Sclerophora amabilis]|nr:MAG: hypothetical protein M1837_000093 [Sclerophora amabilis]
MHLHGVTHVDSRHHLMSRSPGFPRHSHQIRAAESSHVSPLPDADETFTQGLVGVRVGVDVLLTQALFFSFLAFCVFTFVARILKRVNAHIRHLHCMSSSHQTQHFWNQDRWRWHAKMKKHLLYAALWKKRHNREFQLSSAINFGTLPSRYHSLLLFLYLASNFAYCAILDYSAKTTPQLFAELRGRSGVMATANLVPLILLAGRNNPLIRLLRVSFDTYNLLHRWMGRMVVVEAVVHTGAWLANNCLAHGWQGVGEKLAESKFLQWGLVGTVGMVVLGLHSPSAIRHAFYETFLHIHQLAAVGAIFGTYYHLHLHGISQLMFVQLAIIAWAADRLIRFVRMVYRCYDFKNGWSTVLVEALPGEACRVTFDLRRPWTFKAGCHVYAYIPRVSLHQSHPFSLAWKHDEPVFSSSSSIAKGDDLEKLPSMQVDYDNPTRYTTSVSVVISRRTGMTASLYERAIASPDGRFVTRGAVEGPYGGLDSLHSYGTIVLFAGGVGITHQIGHVRELLAGYDNGTVAARKITLVWTVRNTENLEWVRPWMDVILQMRSRREVLKVILFVTRPKSPREVISPSATVQMYPGRPDAQSIIDKEIEQRVGAMAVTVCGPGSLADSVRHAARRRVDIASLDFIEEAFTW